MNKHTLIGIIASVVIAVSFVYSGWNIYAADQLQFRGAEEPFSYYKMMSEGSVAVCNPLPFYVNFNGINVVPFFEGENKGTLSIPPVTISPSSSLIVNGTFLDLQNSIHSVKFCNFSDLAYRLASLNDLNFLL